MTTRTRSNLVAVTIAVAIVATVLVASFVFADPTDADTLVGACDGSTDVCGYITECDAGPDIGTDEYAQAPTTTCPPSPTSTSTTTTAPAEPELIPPLCLERDATGAPVEVDCGAPDLGLDELDGPDLELEVASAPAPLSFTG